MGNGLGKDEKKKVQVNKSNSYPQTKRGRRSTVDGTLPHLNLEVEAATAATKKHKGGKFSTGNFDKDTKLQQQLADLQLGETQVKRTGNRKAQLQSENGHGSDSETTRKRGSKLGFLQNSLKRTKISPRSRTSTPTPPPPPTPPLPPTPTPYDTNFEGDTDTSDIGNTGKTVAALLPRSSSASTPSSPSHETGYDCIKDDRPGVSSLSDESLLSSSVSSLEVGKGDSFRRENSKGDSFRRENSKGDSFRRENSKGDSFRRENSKGDSFRRENSYGTNGFVDPDNVVGTAYDPPKNPTLYRPRGRSVSDSLYSGEASREPSISEIQRATENEKKKNRRFQEFTKILGERKNIIIDILDLTFVRKVGEGAFSEVWEGYWNGVHVAIKKLKSMVDDELFQERFLREVESLRKGNHQNVVMFFGVCLRPPCIITEFMAGGNLYDYLHKTGMRFPTALVVKLALDLAVGLLHLHSLTILHRDLTSLNILLDDMGNIKISDFGLSREKTREGSMTMTLGGICNPRWRPPEITKNIGHYSEKVDVYSFGLVVWELLTGELPFANLDGPQAAAQVAYTGLRPTIPPTCPANLRKLIQRCWADDAKARPTFKEIVDELRSIQFNNPMGFASEHSK